jgi:glyoxylase-like metal-dependent hydrolase (beta-lactamase superfamily II)
MLMKIEDGVHLTKNPHKSYFVSSVLFTGKSLTLIDAGRAESPSTSIYPSIKDLRRDPEEISLIVLTHAHWDHCAGAAEIKNDTGCEVTVHRMGEKYLLDPDEVNRDLGTRFPGIPLGDMDKFNAIIPDTLLEDGSEIELEDRKLKIIHTPGHSACSCCIVEPDLGLDIAGDSIQGRGENRPLLFHDAEEYLKSMKRLMDEPIKKLVSGHPFPPYSKAILGETESTRQIEESVLAVEELKRKILRTLESFDSPVSTQEIFEAANSARPYTVGCILEALEHEGKISSIKERHKVLWQT